MRKLIALWGGGVLGAEAQDRRSGKVGGTNEGRMKEAVSKKGVVGQVL